MNAPTCRTVWTALTSLKQREQRVYYALERARHTGFELGSLRELINGLAEDRRRYHALLEQRVELGDNQARQIQLQDYLALQRCVAGCVSTKHSPQEIWEALLRKRGYGLELNEAGRLQMLALDRLDLTSVVIPATLTDLSTLSVEENSLTQFFISGSLSNLQELSVFGNKLSTLEIPASLTKLARLLTHRNDLAQLAIPESLTKLRELLASENPRLTTLIIPGSLSPEVTLTECPSLSTETRASAASRGWVLEKRYDVAAPQRRPLLTLSAQSPQSRPRNGAP